MKKNIKTAENIIASLGLETAHGTFAAHYSANGLAELDFPGQRKLRETTETPPSVRRWHKLTTRAVTQILEGKETGEMPPLDVAGATAFRRKVWDALQQIKASETKSYREVAAAIGAPKGARAVGNACGANPIPLLIPCHRVLETGGGLGGFTSGLDWKRKLLRAEGKER
jgi:O-6-methylguanine DNA methyltransferase